VADVKVVDGPPVIKSENARLNGWSYVDIAGRDLGSYVAEAQQVVADFVDLPAGYSLAWSGQYEYMVRAKERLSIVGPVTLAIIVLLLYLNFRRFAEVAIIIGTLPMALIGGLWLLYLLGYDLSVAVGVGFIALAGVAVEIGVVMLVYLNQAIRQHIATAEAESRALTLDDVRQAVIDGAVMRVRPIMMTVAAIIAGLLPIMLGGGTGSEVMRRIAAPMVGGMVSATILTLIVIPALFLLWRTQSLHVNVQAKGNTS
jgi:Cu(I)/Ag(I) efflux system membrane protein CusA/SilA